VSAAADPIETISTPINALAEALREAAPEVSSKEEPLGANPPEHSDILDAITPPVPESIEECGIPPSIIEHLILKYLYFRGEMLGREISATLGLKFSLIDELLETLKRQHYVGVKKSLGIGNSSGVFFLTESGRNLTREYLENNLYAGPAPVPLYQYTEVVRRQKLRDNWLNPTLLKEAFRHLVVEQDILAQIGPAVNASKSFLIYGQPGNGKTALAEALFRVDTDPIYMPYAIECQGNIVQLYDPIYHQKIEDQEMAFSAAISLQLPYDGRWFKCRRPFIITGGELTLDMLDLSYNKISKVYDAPFQLKSNNGIYLLDDFGRQKCTPQEILNRWIVPMERHTDYLSFQAGGKMTVPFEAFLIFSTNLRPDNLGDEAFLRRIQYKMFLRNPRAPEFITIFERFAKSRQVLLPAGLIDSFVEKHYVKGGKRFRRCHPRDVISHAIDIIHFEGLPMELNEDVLDRAFFSCFTESVDVTD
jgi:DNA-binding MarR family transcriptional regulator